MVWCCGNQLLKKRVRQRHLWWAIFPSVVRWLSANEFLHETRNNLRVVVFVNQRREQAWPGRGKCRASAYASRLRIDFCWVSQQIGRRNKGGSGAFSLKIEVSIEVRLWEAPHREAHRCSRKVIAEDAESCCRSPARFETSWADLIWVHHRRIPSRSFLSSSRYAERVRWKCDWYYSLAAWEVEVIWLSIINQVVKER